MSQPDATRVASRHLARLDRDVLRLFKPGTFFHTFFSEKDIPHKVFKVKDSMGVEHMIPNEVVIEHIAQTRGGEARQIEQVLRKIDFANGDVNHFLAHLAKAIAEQYAGVLR